MSEKTRVTIRGEFLAPNVQVWVDGAQGTVVSASATELVVTGLASDVHAVRSAFLAVRTDAGFSNPHEIQLVPRGYTRSFEYANPSNIRDAVAMEVNGEESVWLIDGDKGLHRLDLATGILQRVSKGTELESAIAIAEDGNGRLVVATDPSSNGWNGTARLVEIKDGRPVLLFAGRDVEDVRSMAFGPEGELYLASGFYIHRLNPDGSFIYGWFQHGASEISAIAAGDDRLFFATWPSEIRSLAYDDPTSHETVVASPMYDGERFSYRDGSIYWSCYDICRYDLATEEIESVAVANGEEVSSWSPLLPLGDGSLVTIEDDRIVRMPLVDGLEYAWHPLFQAVDCSYSALMSGDDVIYSDYDGTMIRISPAGTSQLIGMYDRRVDQAAMAPDGRIYAAGDNRALFFADPATGASETITTDFPSLMGGVAIGDDGMIYLAVMDEDDKEMIGVLDPTTGESRYLLEAGSSSQYAILTQGGRLFYADADGSLMSVAIDDPESVRRETFSLPRTIYNLSKAADGSIFITMSDESVLELAPDRTLSMLLDGDVDDAFDASAVVVNGANEAMVTTCSNGEIGIVSR